jgi:hypothetical protein
LRSQGNVVQAVDVVGRDSFCKVIHYNTEPMNPRPTDISLASYLIQTYKSNSRMNAVISKSDTKQRILDSAERLFAENGF